MGGEWRLTMRGLGMELDNPHRWTALSPPGDRVGRIAFLMDGPDGNPPKEVTVTFTPKGSGTRLRQVMVFPTAA